MPGQERDYKVSFGSIARTILYEDSLGTLRFTFDVDTSRGQETIVLEGSVKPPSADAEVRNNLARDRIREYLVALGYQVEVVGRGRLT